MNIDFAYCKGKIYHQGVMELEGCPMRKTCKRYLEVLHDNHFAVPSIPPKNDYLCWVQAHECAKRDYVLYLKDDENITANMQNCVSSKDYVVQCDYDEQTAIALIHATNQGII